MSGRAWATVGLAWLLPGEAAAFCGTYVGGAGETLQNYASLAVVAHERTRTTLTLAMDYEGDASQFALLLPVPEILTDEDVKTVDPAIIKKVAQYTTPRMVRYTCGDVESPSYDSVAPGCAFIVACTGAKDSSLGGAGSLGRGGAELGSSVEVVSSFSVAAYEIVVLSAEESGDLQGWLAANGYAIPAGGEEILQEYIDSGAYFLAAKVTLEAAQEGKQWLPPLQIGYESELFGLPIRIGTISSPGEQEMMIYTITDHPSAVGIANYPQVTVEDECMPLGGADLSTTYDALFTAALGGEAGYVREYSLVLSQQQNCDPCTAAPFNPAELRSLGYVGINGNPGFLTALRLRYTPAQATQDLVFYQSDIAPGGGWGATYNYGAAQDQIRFIEYASEMEAFFPVCGEGFVEDPDTCWEEPEGGCASSAPLSASAFGIGGPLSSLAVLITLAIRRRTLEKR